MLNDQQRHILGRELGGDPEAVGYRDHGFDYESITALLHDSEIIYGPNPEPQPMIDMPVPMQMSDVLDLLAADEKSRLISLRSNEVLDAAWAAGLDVDQLAMWILRDETLGDNPKLYAVADRMLDRNDHEMLSQLISMLSSLTDETGDPLISPETAAALQERMTLTELVPDPSWSPNVLVSHRPSRAFELGITGAEPIDVRHVLTYPRYGALPWP